MPAPITAVLDTFTRANETPIAGNWSGPVISGSGLILTSNRLGSGGIFQSSYWNAAQFGPNCEVYATIAVKPGVGDNMELYARLSTPGATVTGYVLRFKGGSPTDQLQLLRRDSGVEVAIGFGDTSALWNVNDKMFLRISGSTIEGWRYNSVAATWTLLCTTTDATYAGAGFIGASIDDSVSRYDDFGGGTVSVSTAPSAPLSPSATPGNNQVALSWTVPASNGGSAITGYKIYRSLTTNTETLLASPAGTGTAYTDSTAVNGTQYFYKISAVNAIGESVLSSEVNATPVAPNTVPSAPLGLVAVASNAQVALTWNVPASNGGLTITAYKIYRSTVSGSETLLASPSGTGTNYTDLTPVNGTTYYYKVSAVNALGESALSGEANATPSLPAPSSAPRTLKRLYGPTLLSNVAATLYTVPASTTAVIRHIHVSNPTGSPVNFTLSIGASAAGTRIWDAQPIPAADVLDHYQDFSLATGEIVQGFAGTASVLNLVIDGYELGAVAAPPPPPPDIFPSDTLFPSDTYP